MSRTSPNRWRVEANPISFDEFRKQVLDMYAPPMRAKSTCGQIRQVLGFLAELGVETTADLNCELVKRFLGSRPQTEHPNNTAGHLRRLRTLCSIAQDNNWLEVSPFELRKRWFRGVTPKPKPFFSREEIKRLLDYLEADIPRKAKHKQSQGWAEWRAWRLYALVATVAYTGMRKMEALTLRREDIDLKRRIINIRSRKDYLLKTAASDQPVPIPPELFPILRQWLLQLDRVPDRPATLPPRQQQFMDKFRGHALEAVKRARTAPRDPGILFPNCYNTMPWTGGPKGSKPNDKLKSAGLRVGLEGVTFLSLRHSFATFLERQGLSNAQIQRLLRHTSPRTQMHYRHAEDGALGEIGAKITFHATTPSQPAAGDVEGDPDQGLNALEELNPELLEKLCFLMEQRIRRELSKGDEAK